MSLFLPHSRYSRCCINSFNWFFWILRKWVNESVSSSFSILSSSYSLASLLLKLIRSLSMLKNVCSRSFFNFQKLWLHFGFIFLISANNSKFATSQQWGIVDLCHTKKWVCQAIWMKLTLIWVHASRSNYCFGWFWFFGSQVGWFAWHILARFGSVHPSFNISIPLSW